MVKVNRPVLWLFYRVYTYSTVFNASIRLSAEALRTTLTRLAEGRFQMR